MNPGFQLELRSHVHESEIEKRLFQETHVLRFVDPTGGTNRGGAGG